MIRCLLSLTLAIAFVGSALAAGPNQGPTPAILPAPMVQSPMVQGPMVQAPMFKAAMFQAPSKTIANVAPCSCERCIIYKHLRPRCEPCGPRYETVLFAKDPCTCCDVQVPVCLPTCCTGEPQICCKGLRVTEYTWCTGYKVRVIVAGNGKVIVHYNA